MRYYNQGGLTLGVILVILLIIKVTLQIGKMIGS
jgi:hypothetical protein